MNVWDFIQCHKLQHKIRFKKWSDIKSDHFFSLELDEAIVSFSNQKKLHRRNEEELNETGNHLIYVSTGHVFIKDQVELPLFLSPVRGQIHLKTKSIRWSIQNEEFLINHDAMDEGNSLSLNEINEWLALNRDRFGDKLRERSVALYFNINTRQFSNADLEIIREQNESSQAMDTLFHADIKFEPSTYQSEFLKLNHILPIDYSQSQTITAALNSSIVISGPPGTGKSQTILNLAIEEISRHKRVAIISEKQAALEVLTQRADQLGVSPWILSIPQFKNDVDTIANVEAAAESVLNLNSASEEIPFNYSYYAHAIRTLEDYFNASMRNESNKNSNLTETKIDKDIIRNTDLKWIKPSQELIDIDRTQSILLLAELRELLNKLSIDFELDKFQILNELESILELIHSQSTHSLQRWLDSKSRVKKSWIRETKKLTSIQNKIQKLGTIDLSLSNESIELLKAYYLNSNFISKLFNSDAKKIEGRIEKSDKNWNSRERLNKIKILNENLVLNQRKSELEEARNTLDELEIENGWRNQTQVFEYIESKFNSNNGLWRHIHSSWILKKNYSSIENLWKSVSIKFKEIKQLKINFEEIRISDFQKNEPRIVNSISQKEWDAVCCMKFRSSQDWIDFLNSVETKSSLEPVLKNYTKREIAFFAQYCRRNYSKFSLYNNQQWQNDNINKRRTELKEILTSRKPEDKEKKERWKRSIAFIQKNWSKKRKKLSFYQFFNQIDFEFALWLKPISILTFEQLSQFFPLQKEIFDTLIIDESSQVEVINTIPALYRAKKVIIVGDNKQLTPSRFFRNLGEQKQFNYESILELAEEKLHSYQLNYHYRSKYKELIGYSNHHFYNFNLHTTRRSNRESIVFKHIENGSYINRKNAPEASELIAFLLRNIESWVDRSIGVICFSIQQKEALEDALDQAIEINPYAQNLLQAQKQKSEYFFIKNIENVQGDERDIILISVGYGKNQEGKIYQFFGPILAFQGENRLNVLMSRSKEKMVIFSSIKATDIQVKNQSSNGLKLFREFLSYIERPSFFASRNKSSELNYWDYYLNPFRN